MNFPNIKKGSNFENGNNILFNETINFIPLTSYYCGYLERYIEYFIFVSGSFNKGKCFLYSGINNNKKEQKVLILEKKIGNNNNEINALAVTLGEKEIL